MASLLVLSWWHEEEANQLIKVEWHILGQASLVTWWQWSTRPCPIWTHLVSLVWSKVEKLIFAVLNKATPISVVSHSDLYFELFVLHWVTIISLKLLSPCSLDRISHAYQPWYSVFLSQQNSISRLISHRNDQANRMICVYMVSTRPLGIYKLLPVRMWSVLLKLHYVHVVSWL